MRKAISLFVAFAVALSLAGCSKKLTPEQVKEKSKQGLQLVQSGNYAEANKVLEEVAGAKDVDAKTYIVLGISRYQKQDYKGALEAYDKAIALDPKLAEAYQGKANVYRNQKNMTEAEVWYRKAWQANPLFVDAYTELALQLNLAGKLSNAITVLEEGFRNNPGSVDMGLLLGSYYRDNGQKDKAVEVFQAVLKLDPNNKMAKDALAALK